MPLIMNIEDVRFVKQFARELSVLNHRVEFIREMARVVLAEQ